MYSLNELKKLIQDSPEQVVEALAGQNISPANISASGSISGDEIIENMSGYSFSMPYDGESYTINIPYAGVVKTGNKITFAIALEFTRISDSIDNYWPQFGRFAIPEEIYNKLFPSLSNILDTKSLVLLSSASDTNPPSLYGRVTKHASLHEINFVLAQPQNLTKDTTYFTRYEATFLLSENLAPQGE